MGNRMNTLTAHSPLKEELATELFAFWERIFHADGTEPDPDVPIDVFLGSESTHNEHTIWMERRQGALVGTCGMTVGKKTPALGGFGEVGTDPRFRRKGIATRLSGHAVEEFQGAGGEAFFLGTGNPLAERVYQKLGWRRMAGSNVWANITNGDSPEAFLVDYYRDGQTVSITRGDASLRIPMIPLLLTPHDPQILDANVGMFSTRYSNQGSCMGLCRRYYRVVQQENAAWYVAKTHDDKLVGIATGRIDHDAVCDVDGFTHKRYEQHWPALIQAVIEWGDKQSASSFRTSVSLDDRGKLTLFEDLGFRLTGQQSQFNLGERSVVANLLTKT